MTVEEQISAVEKQIEELEVELTAAQKRLHLLQMEKHGISVGMLVEAKGKIYRVTGAKNFWAGQPWLYGTPQRKDGTFGAERNIYDGWKRLA